MKLSEKTIKSIVDELSSFDYDRYPTKAYEVATKFLQDLDLSIKPYDQSQSTLVISGEKE